jgi:hypothetical protein
VFITLLMLVMFGAVWTMQGTWMLSGTGSSGCMNKILLPLLTSCDFQVSLDWLIDELNLHCSRWISEVASTGFKRLGTESCGQGAQPLHRLLDAAMPEPDRCKNNWYSRSRSERGLARAAARMA